MLVPAAGGGEEVIAPHSLVDRLDALARRIGAPVALRPEPGLAISAGHVHARQS